MNMVRNFLLLLFMLFVMMEIGNTHEIGVIKCYYGTSDKSLIFGAGTTNTTLNATRIRNGLTYRYHVENIRHPNETNDYVVIENREHRITYPLKCKKL